MAADSPIDWHGERYRRFRPDYPNALFHWLLDQSPSPGRAWDCGCGSGQATLALCRHFRSVIASDLSLSQLCAFSPPAHCHRMVARAENAPVATQSLDLIIAAQALHWFDYAAFISEVTRVARPGALLAVFGYGLCEVDGDHEQLIRTFHDQDLEHWWAPERQRLINRYEDFPLPGGPLGTPLFCLERQWRCDEMLGYLGTWSALGAASQEGATPLQDFAPRLEAFWGTRRRRVRWPLHLRAARL